MSNHLRSVEDVFDMHWIVQMPSVFGQCGKRGSVLSLKYDGIIRETFLSSICRDSLTKTFKKRMGYLVD